MKLPALSAEWRATDRAVAGLISYGPLKQPPLDSVPPMGLRCSAAEFVEIFFDLDSLPHLSASDGLSWLEKLN